MKIRHCTICEVGMRVPPTSSKKYCRECDLQRRRDYAHMKYLEAIDNGKVHEYREKARNQVRIKKLNDPIYRLLARARGRATTQGLPFDLARDDIVIPDKCPVLETPFEYKTYYTASLDRINSSEGYVKGNVQVMSHKANAMKNSATPEELIKFAEWVLKVYAGK